MPVLYCVTFEINCYFFYCFVVIYFERTLETIETNKLLMHVKCQVLSKQNIYKPVSYSL